MRPSGCFCDHQVLAEAQDVVNNCDGCEPANIMTETESLLVDGYTPGLLIFDT